jgi:hypothetical protein
MSPVPILLAALALPGCLTSNAGAWAGDADGGPACVQSGDTYVCPGGTEPACSAPAGAICDYGIAYCLRCDDGGGVGCSCEEAGGDAQGGGRWVCLDNGVVCR